jgi:hypothetical protein
MKNIIVLTSLMIALSFNLYSQWVNMSNGIYDLRVYAIAANNTHIFAATGEALSISTNNGTNWSRYMFNAVQEPVHSIIVSGTTVYSGISGYGVTVCLNNGSGGCTFHHPLGNRTIYSLNYTSGGILFAGSSVPYSGSDLPGVYYSTNNGYSFSPTSLLSVNAYALTSNSTTVFAGTAEGGVYLTTNNGVNWTQTSLNNQVVKSLASNGNTIYAGTLNGVFISTNNGASWVQSTLNSGEILALAVSGSSVFACSGPPSNFYVSNNNGATWTLRNEGLGSVTVDAVCIANNYLFAGTPGSGVFRRSLAEVVGIHPVSNEVPENYSLSQNYPNPFNPATKIRFDIPKSEFTVLKIYDAVGSEVYSLVNEQLYAGIYEVQWDASGYPSGVYYYKLTAGDFSETKKMILIK